ncbi:hypothetical protein RFEPED_1605 [Rickettsia felis str. Pedreira]|uniref:Uncharacterized protein n=1 Tax=Rickettsia felis str. Pedreira TaxID=1359196 RepID=A0A0F3MXD2_RICFI|nr:hypothetical protein RFEPED_1605 [Rickettsia felis str. Pedreira]
MKKRSTLCHSRIGGNDIGAMQQSLKQDILYYSFFASFLRSAINLSTKLSSGGKYLLMVLRAFFNASFNSKVDTLLLITPPAFN